MLDFIYKVSKKFSFDIGKLCEIDPYGDTELPLSDLPDIIRVCDYILEKSLLQNNSEYEGNQAIYGLKEIARKAMEKKVGLISIGD